MNSDELNDFFHGMNLNFVIQSTFKAITTFLEIMKIHVKTIFYTALVGAVAI